MDLHAEGAIYLYSVRNPGIKRDSTNSSYPSSQSPVINLLTGELVKGSFDAAGSGFLYAYAALERLLGALSKGAEKNRDFFPSNPWLRIKANHRFSSIFIHFHLFFTVISSR